MMNMYQKGRKYLEQQRYDSAKRCFCAGHDAGDPKCTYGLYATAAASGGNCDPYLQELRSAIPRLQEMAEHGSTDACFILGRCYETGSGLPLDIFAAIKYYTKAAALGDPDAQFNLGCIYMRLGTGGEPIAVDYFQQAARQGSRDACAALEHYRKQQEKQRG